MQDLHPDLFAILISVALLLAYYVLLLLRTRRDPQATIQVLNNKTRLLWVRGIMRDKSKDIMAVQTLRNFEMAATFKASSAILLILGTLSLTGQGENLARTWHVLNGEGAMEQHWWTVKIICLLTILIIAFFAFAMAIRNLNHVVFMIGLPHEDAHGLLSPDNIAQRLNQAGMFYSIGTRAYFFTVPFAFWLFGPHFLIGATAGLVLILYFLDRVPDSSHV